MRAAFASVSALVLVSLACGGKRVGDEGYFYGEKLPSAEPSPAAAASASATASATASAGAAPTDACGTPPPRGFLRCDPDRKNEPCVSGGIGGCLLYCAGQPPKDWPCPTPAKP